MRYSSSYFYLEYYTHAIKVALSTKQADRARFVLTETLTAWPRFDNYNLIQDIVNLNCDDLRFAILHTYEDKENYPDFKDIHTEHIVFMLDKLYVATDCLIEVFEVGVLPYNPTYSAKIFFMRLCGDMLRYQLHVCYCNLVIFFI